MAHGPDMQGPNVFAKEHGEAQQHTFVGMIHELGSAGLEHLKAPLRQIASFAGGTALHLRRHP